MPAGRFARHPGFFVVLLFIVLLPLLLGTAATFWRRPPIAPIEPSVSIVPVTAMRRPPVSEPELSRSMSVSVKARPAGCRRIAAS